MYVLCLVDGINEGFGAANIDEKSSVICVSNSVDDLKKYAVGQYDDELTRTSWGKDKNFPDRLIGKTYYDDELEEEQYFVIVKVKEIKYRV